MSTNKSERERELEQAKKKWDQYYKDNAGKISSDFPPTIFDNELNKPNTGTNEIKKLYKLLNDNKNRKR